MLSGNLAKPAFNLARIGLEQSLLFTGRSIFSNTRLSLSSQVPFTIANAAALNYLNPLPKPSPSVVQQWLARKASSFIPEQKLVNLFTEGSAYLSPSNMSAEKLEKIEDKSQFITHLTPILDSFFPIDAPNDTGQQIQLTEALCKAIKNNANAKAFQAKVFSKLCSFLGFSTRFNRITLEKNFTAKDCFLLQTPNGRSALSQIIRSMHLLGNQSLALQLQTILLSIGHRYAIPASKMLDIALANSSEYWSTRNISFSEPVAKAFTNAIDIKMPKLGLFSLSDLVIPKEYLGSMGNSTADFLLGHINNENNKALRSVLTEVILEKNLRPLSSDILSLFPVDITYKDNNSAAFSAAKDTVRCFRVNPLLRYSHRMITGKILEKYHLNLLEKKSLNLKPEIEIENLDWLQSDNSQAENKRKLLLQIIASLYILQNQKLALNIRNKAVALIEQYYQGEDKLSILNEFNAIISASSLEPFSQEPQDSDEEAQYAMPVRFKKQRLAIRRKKATISQSVAIKPEISASEKDSSSGSDTDIEIDTESSAKPLPKTKRKRRILEWRASKGAPLNNYQLEYFDPNDTKTFARIVKKHIAVLESCLKESNHFSFLDEESYEKFDQILSQVVAMSYYQKKSFIPLKGKVSLLLDKLRKKHQEDHKIAKDISDNKQALLNYHFKLSAWLDASDFYFGDDEFNIHKSIEARIQAFKANVSALQKKPELDCGTGYPLVLKVSDLLNQLKVKYHSQYTRLQQEEQARVLRQMARAKAQREAQQAE